MLKMNILQHNQPFQLEAGGQLDQVRIAYSAYGQLNASRDNVIWVSHALTGNSQVHEWWSGMIGPGKIFDTNRYFIVCANMLGSCYGSSSAKDGAGWDFPLLTIRDMVAAHRLLYAHLGIRGIALGIGGSMGGQQIVEWAISEPEIFANICLLATNAQHSPWGIAFNEAQRMALTSSADVEKGLEAARAIAMLSYRTYQIYEHGQSESDLEKLDDFRASSYQNYQGQKLQQRFDPYAYWYLSKAMDSHNVGRDRGGVRPALARITAKALVIGIHSDILFPPSEQRLLTALIPDARLELIQTHSFPCNKLQFFAIF